MDQDTTGRPVYCDGRVHVLSTMCTTCVFRPGNLMRLQPGRLAGMVAEATSSDYGSITCHSTIHGEAEQEAICRGFFDRYAGDVLALRLAMALDVIEEVEPTTAE